MSTEVSSEDSTGHQSLGGLLKHTYRAYDALVNGALAPFRIDRRDLAVLIRLAEEDLLSQQQAAARLGIDRTTMVAVVDGLEQKRLVRRTPHPNDRRKNVVTLTDAGRRTMAEATTAALDAERRFLEPLGEAGAPRFTAALRTLLSAWDVRPPATRD